jgi:ribosome-associated protein
MDQLERPTTETATPSLPQGISAAVQRALELAVDRKAHDILLLDLRPVSDATDFFLIMTGTSDTHVRAIADHISEELKKTGVRADHLEGQRGGHWVLLDYIDFVIHVFHPAAREFYQLERLWGDAPNYSIES